MADEPQNLPQFLPAASPLSIQPMEVKDFSGGITDYYLGGPIGTKYQRADNLLILNHGGIGKLKTRQGSQIYDAVNYQVPAGVIRIGTLKYFNGDLFTQAGALIYNLNVPLLTPSITPHNTFPAGFTTANVVTMSTWNNQLFFASDFFSLPGKIYRDNNLAGALQFRTAGMPPLPSAPTVMSSGGTGSNYLYRFLFSYTYHVGDVEFIDKGASTEVPLFNVGAPDSDNVAISAIPTTVSSAAGIGYDTANIVTEIYRTIDNGTDFFLVGTTGTPVTTFTDSTSDATLLNQKPLYTNDGQPDNDTPPPCKIVHIVEDRGFYGNCKVGGILYPNRIYQSVPGSPGTVPATFFHDCRDTITAISSVRDLPVAIGTTDVYRLDNGITSLGQGDITPTTISINGGCVSAVSTVQTPEGVWWAGNDGFYFTDAYNVLRVSTGINLTYQKLVASQTRKNRIVGKYDPQFRRIYWTVMQGGGATDCDSCFVLDLNFGIGPDMPFTTISGGANFAPTAIEFIGTNLLRGDSRGYTFIHQDANLTDPVVNTATLPSTWDTATIIHDHISLATDFGSSHVRKWVTNCSLVCQNETNLSLQVVSINDDGRLYGNLSAIRARGNLTWGDPDVYWGDNSLIWGDSGLIDVKRKFPAGGLRCEYKQIQLTNAKTAIVSSDLLGLATVNFAAKTVTLGSTTWPTHSIGYVVAFAADGYVREYPITVRTDSVVTYLDTGGFSAASNGSTQWVMRGFPQGEVLHLISYDIHYAMLGMTQEAFSKANTGEVGS